MADSSGLS
ncbi:hypothetical protein E2320_011180, partial [Naja naja]